MSSEQNERPSVPQLCANNCGFYGNPANRNLCSKCYREYLKTEGGDGSSGATAVAAAASPPNGWPLAAVAASMVETPLQQQQVVLQQQTPGEGVSGAPAQAATQQTAVASDIQVPAQLSGRHESPICASNPTGVETAAVEVQAVPTKPQQHSTTRCWKCNKKTGLLGFACRCGYSYCGEHRYADTHDCQFDYKTYEREQLRKQNNRVVAEKLEKI